jgi:hypothetical protein
MEGKRLSKERLVSRIGKRSCPGCGGRIEVLRDGGSAIYGSDGLLESFADRGYGYDPYTANPFGRYFYVELAKKF